MKLITTLASSILAILAIVSQSSISADMRFYAGGSVGDSHTSFDARDFGGTGPDPGMPPIFGFYPLRTPESKQRDTGYNVFAGYDFNRNWAIEGGYSLHGRFQYSVKDVDSFKHIFSFATRSWTLAAKASLPVSERFGLFAKFGAAVNSAKNNYSVNPGLALPLLPGKVSEPVLTSLINPGSYSKTATMPFLGIGLEYAPWDKASIRVQYEDYGRFGGQTSTGRARIDMTSVGISYKF